MRGLLAALLAVTPLALFAQHQGHTMPTTKKPAVKKQTTKKQATKRNATTKRATTKKKATAQRKTTTTRRSSATTKKQADPHKGHAAPAKQPTRTPAKRPANQPDPHQGHGSPNQQPTKEPTKQPDPHKGHAAPAKQPTSTPAKRPANQPDPHQGHGSPNQQPTKEPTKQPDPHQGHPPTTPPTTGGGQQPTTQPQQQHQGHGGTPSAQQQQQQQGQNPTFPPPDPFPQYDKRGWPKPVMDDMKYSFTLFERLEYLPNGGGGELAWDVISWHGGDYRRIWVKSEGEQSFRGGREGSGDIEVHMGRLIKPFVDFLVGARFEGQWGGGSRGRVSVGAGFQALQPYVVESEAFVFLSQSGQIYFNATAARDFYLSQRMVLQPRIETNLALNRDRRFGSEAGLQDLDLSLRLRYEIRREFAPYIGVSGRWLFGGTASAARSRGDETSGLRFIFGLRFWF